ncbi:MAG: thioredoxin family protein [Synergistaceae bacterium]|nr:thioredoxin family protein [Synergistaceae bacterium]
MDKDKRKSMSVKLIIVSIVIVAVFAIYVYKQQNIKSLNDDVAGVNPDFALKTETLDLEKLKSYGLPILIDFGADSCVPCKEMAPVLEKLNKKYQGKVIIKFVDVWRNPKLAENFPVQVIPTQFFFNSDGSPLAQEANPPFDVIGYINKETQEQTFTVHQGGLTEEQLEAVFIEMGLKQQD